MGRYVRLCKGVKDCGRLIEEHEVYDKVDQVNDWYQGIYYYDDSHLEIFKVKGTIKGIKDVVTNKLVFDFDSDNPEEARSDAKTLIERLRNQGIDPDALQIYYSGNKGFHVIVPVDRDLSPDSCYELASKYAGDLDTFDSSLYDAPQLLRIPSTIHPTTRLYKLQLSVTDLYSRSLSEILDQAKEPQEDFSNQELIHARPEFYHVEKKKTTVVAAEYKIDLSKKPKYWRNCKWSLLQGNFKDGDRDNAMMALAATGRALKYDYHTTYYLCKSALQRSWKVYGEGEFNKQELWDKVIKQVFIDDGWKGGSYSCKTDPWMSEYCKNLGEFACKDHEDEPSTIDLEKMGSEFISYATDFEQNVIRTGIIELDDNVTMCASTLIGLLGQPGAGKTSIAIQYLRNTSLSNIPSMFFSLDMGLPIVYAKLAQKYTEKDFKSVMKMFREEPGKSAEIMERIKSDYKNVGFCFQSGVTIADMRNAITDQQDRTGKAVKLVVIDYLECIAGPYSDAVANTGFIANQLKDLANEFGACVLLLLQTQKHSTPSISDPLMSLKAVKGSSIIEQSCSTILTLWRDGYSPETIEDDRYMSFAVVKNRFGTLWKGDFAWNGIKGEVRSLSDEERFLLKEFKGRKQVAALEKLKAQMPNAANNDAIWR